MVGQLVDALFQENWDEDIIVGHLTGVSEDDTAGLAKKKRKINGNQNKRKQKV